SGGGWSSCSVAGIPTSRTQPICCGGSSARTARRCRPTRSSSCAPTRTRSTELRHAGLRNAKALFDELLAWCSQAGAGIGVPRPWRFSPRVISRSNYYVSRLVAVSSVFYDRPLWPPVGGRGFPARWVDRRLLIRTGGGHTRGHIVSYGLQGSGCSLPGGVVRCRAKLPAAVTGPPAQQHSERDAVHVNSGGRAECRPQRAGERALAGADRARCGAEREAGISATIAVPIAV